MQMLQAGGKCPGGTGPQGGAGGRPGGAEEQDRG